LDSSSHETQDGQEELRQAEAVEAGQGHGGGAVEAEDGQEVGEEVGREGHGRKQPQPAAQAEDGQEVEGSGDRPKNVQTFPDFADLKRNSERIRSKKRESVKKYILSNAYSFN
jgi:hypothetical protein